MLKQKPDEIKKAIKKIDSWNYQNISGLVDRLNEMYEIVMESDDRLDNLMCLFKKALQECYSTHMEEVDEPFYKILETTLLEIKKIPSKEQKVFVNRIVSLLKEYDFYDVLLEVD